MLHTDLPSLAIQKAHDQFFASATGAGNLGFLVLVHEAGEAADKAFVHFHFASKLLKGSALHCCTDPVKHEPCGLLSNAKVTGKLAGAYTILAITDQPNRGEPLIKADRRIFKDGSDLGAKLLFGVLGLALPYLTSSQQRDFSASARGASYAVGPAERYGRPYAVGRIREVANRFVKRGRYVRVHAQNIA